MRYPEHAIADMRADLARYGVEETKTPEAVDAVLAPGSGAVMMVVNSYCGCAAGKARPAIGAALQGDTIPQKSASVFAGGDVEATSYLREKYLAEYEPSSPSIALFQDGKPVFYLHRREIESRTANEVFQVLRAAFAQHCAQPSLRK
jgi:putative YphP/YqiW family bacilliredoxin